MGQRPVRHPSEIWPLKWNVERRLDQPIYDDHLCNPALFVVVDETFRPMMVPEATQEVALITWQNVEAIRNPVYSHLPRTFGYTHHYMFVLDLQSRKDHLALGVPIGPVAALSSSSTCGRNASQYIRWK